MQGSSRGGGRAGQGRGRGKGNPFIGRDRATNSGVGEARNSNSNSNSNPYSSPFSKNPRAGVRGLPPAELGGVVFFCTSKTIEECLSKNLFGVTMHPHWEYVKNIRKGMPLFLCNLSEKALHGLFEAASKGKLNIDPTAWSTDGTSNTTFPAQVRVCQMKKCSPISLKTIKQILPQIFFTESFISCELTRSEVQRLVYEFDVVNSPSLDHFSALNVAQASLAWRLGGSNSESSDDLKNCEQPNLSAKGDPEEVVVVGEEKLSSTMQNLGSEADNERETEIDSECEDELVLLHANEMGCLEDFSCNPEPETDGCSEVKSGERPEKADRLEDVWDILRKISANSSSVSLDCEEKLRLCIGALLQLREEHDRLKQENQSLTKMLSEQQNYPGCKVEL